MKDIFRAFAEYSAELRIGTMVLASLIVLTSLVSAQELTYDKGLLEPADPKGDQGVFATITVTSTADVVDAGSCGAITIASLPGPNGVTSLREAVCAANNTAGADTITFAFNGTFFLTGAANDDNNVSGDLDLKDSLTITGNGPGNTVIDGSGIERIFDFFPPNASNFSLSGVTLQNGDTRTTTFKEGGAIYLHNNVTSSISNCVIINNFSGANGAIENRGSLTISNSTISNNQTIPTTGSVVGGAIRNAGPLTITNSTISGNLVRGEGGGIATTTLGGVSVSITNSTISNNTAVVTGGGLGNGGGISTTGNAGALVISNSTISGNHADNDGGGISTNGNQGSIVMTNSTVSGNDARNNGGGAYIVTSAGGTGNATLNSVTVTNNTADSDNNGSGSGGGFAQSIASVTLRNTIVSGNFNSVVSVRDDINGTVQSSSAFNLVGDGTGSAGITNGVNSNQVGSGASPIDALLGPLANNGGSTMTHNLGPPSPAYDKGFSFTLSTDQRGITRPFDNILVPPAPGGDNSDIGAVESQIPTAAYVALSGRILTTSGMGIRNATVTVSGGSLPAPVVVQTGSFGYYRIEGLTAGETYVISVEMKRFWVDVPVRLVTMTDDVTGFDFVAEPR